MEQLLHSLQRDYPNITFLPGERLHWSPHKLSIFYKGNNGKQAIWGLLHEVGHALLDHKRYVNDADLLQKEVAAWGKACEISQAYGIRINEDYIEDCLDTYRDWLHRRSACPTCENHGLETHTGVYSCPNCLSAWKVTSSRFCRPYRLTKSNTSS